MKHLAAAALWLAGFARQVITSQGIDLSMLKPEESRFKASTGILFVAILLGYTSPAFSSDEPRDGDPVTVTGDGRWGACRRAGGIAYPDGNGNYGGCVYLDRRFGIYNKPETGGGGPGPIQRTRTQEVANKDASTDKPCTGNPIIPATGNKIQPEGDFFSSDAMGLYLSRVYNHYWAGAGLSENIGSRTSITR